MAEEKKGIDQVVDKAGSQRALGDVCGVSQQAVQKWVAQGFVPNSRAIELEAQYGVDRKLLVDPKLAELLG